MKAFALLLHLIPIKVYQFAKQLIRREVGLDYLPLTDFIARKDDTTEKLNQHTYVASGVFIDKFKLKFVPSIIKQKGNMIEVQEIHVPHR